MKNKKNKNYRRSKRLSSLQKKRHPKKRRKGLRDSSRRKNKE